LDLLGAVFVPAMLEGPFWRLLPVHSVSAIVLKVWCLRIASAAFLGFMMYKVWRSETSKWVWIFPVLWFGFRALPYSAHVHTVFSEGDGFWAHFSGAGCTTQTSSCRDFFAFTVPLIGAVSYAGAALVASRLLKRSSSPNEPDAEPKAMVTGNPTNE
jgi:hypothetical protein